MQGLPCSTSGTSEIENGLCACTVDNPLAKARVLSLRTGAQAMLYLSPGKPLLPWLKAVDNFCNYEIFARLHVRVLPVCHLFKDFVSCCINVQLLLTPSLN